MIIFFFWLTLWIKSICATQIQLLLAFSNWVFLDFISNKSEFKLVKLAAVTLAAGVLALGSVDGAMAAKSGGRVGGQAFRSAPRSSGPRINNSRYKFL